MNLQHSQTSKNKSNGQLTFCISIMYIDLCTQSSVDKVPNKQICLTKYYGINFVVVLGKK